MTSQEQHQPVEAQQPKPEAKLTTILQNWWIMLLAVVMVVVVSGVYRSHFPGDLSGKQEVWGQFGDYLGGVINPLIGLCTIWLLTVSLKQSNMALAQAREDLRLTRLILEESQKTQQATEESLRKQIEIADQTRDVANAIALWNHLNGKSAVLGAEIEKASHQRDRERSGIDHLIRRKSASDGLAQGLDHIINKEVHRLHNRYLDGSQ